MKANKTFRDFSRLIQLIGGVLLLVGVFAASLGPLEIYTFYSYSPGGRFHHEGFGFGSLLFGSIAIQVVGYYLVAVPFIPLGYGHLRLRRWSRKLTLALLWDWLVVGLPLTIIFFVMLVTAKEPPSSSIPLFGLAFLLMYPILPVLLIYFYRNTNVQLTFQQHNTEKGCIEQAPQRILVLGGLMIFFAVALHVPTLFNGVFPLFGKFLSGWKGFLLTDLSVLLLIFLTWGVLTRREWAWWGSLAYFVLLTLSYTISLLTVGLRDIYAHMRFAQWETDGLTHAPIQGIHFVLLLVLPMFTTLILITTSRRYFERSKSRGSLLIALYILLLILLIWGFLWTVLV